MDTWATFLEKRAMSKKICVILRGLPGSGKSTQVKEVLRQHGGTQDHVFSADKWFHPICNLVDAIEYISSEALSLEKAVEIGERFKKMWYGAKWTPVKSESQANFLDFKKLVDQGKYHEALALIKENLPLFANVEYRSNWDGAKLGAAHAATVAKFKAAMEAGLNPIVVDNCNTVAREVRPYVKHSDEHGYEIVFQEPTSAHWKEYSPLLKDKYINREKLKEFVKILADKNTHGVPEETFRNDC